MPFEMANSVQRTSSRTSNSPWRQSPLRTEGSAATRRRLDGSSSFTHSRTSLATTWGPYPRKRHFQTFLLASSGATTRSPTRTFLPPEHKSHAAYRQLEPPDATTSRIISPRSFLAAFFYHPKNGLTKTLLSVMGNPILGSPLGKESRQLSPWGQIFIRGSHPNP